MENKQKDGKSKPEEWSKFQKFKIKEDSFIFLSKFFFFFKSPNGSNISLETEMASVSSSHRLNQIMSDRTPQMIKLICRKNTLAAFS